MKLLTLFADKETLSEVRKNEANLWTEAAREKEGGAGKYGDRG